MTELAFFVPNLGISGGVAAIFEHGLHLAESGHDVSFVTAAPVAAGDLGWHRAGPGKSDGPRWVTIAQASTRRFDFAIATHWETFFDLWKIEARRYLYFVQSIESRFAGPGDLALRSVIDSTYDVDVGIITEARWIADYLRRVHGREAQVVPNGVDKTAFCTAGPRHAARLPGRLRALVEGPVDVGFKNVPKAIELCRKAGVDELWLLTSSSIAAQEGVDRIFSRVPMDRVSEIYRSCDVLVKLSYVEGMFGPPLEMFHCGGTCVVYDVSGHDEYVVHGYNGLVAKTDDEDAVVRYLQQLRRQPALLAALKAKAEGTASAWPDWGRSASLFADAMAAAAQRETIGRDALRRYACRMWHSYRSTREDELANSWEMSVFQNALRSPSWRIASSVMSALGIDHVRALRGHESIATRKELQPRDRADLRGRVLALYGSTPWGLTAPLRLISRLKRRIAG